MAAVAVMIALTVRATMFDYRSADYVMFLKPWYDHIADNGGYHALRSDFSDYNVPYLYLMAFLTYLPVPALAGIKTISVLFDLLLAFFTYRIVRLRFLDSWQPVAAATAVLFLPTVVANSARWGQADSIFTAFLIGGLYYVLRARHWLAGAFFGLALGFKLQAVFIFPLLGILVLRKRLPWPSLLAIPGVYLALDVPALLLGAAPEKLLTVYARQTGTYQQLTLNAASVYQFIAPGTHADILRTAGVVFTGALVAILTVITVRSRVELTPTRIVLVATASVIAVPFFLPSMHERYFYPADVLSVIAACYLPRRLWYLPVAVQVASFLTYLTYFAQSSQPVGGGATGNSAVSGAGGNAAAFPPAPELKLAAALMALALVAVLWSAVREFRAHVRSTPATGGTGNRARSSRCRPPRAFSRLPGLRQVHISMSRHDGTMTATSATGTAALTVHGGGPVPRIPALAAGRLPPLTMRTAT